MESWLTKSDENKKIAETEKVDEGFNSASWKKIIDENHKQNELEDTWNSALYESQASKKEQEKIIGNLKPKQGNEEKKSKYLEIANQVSENY